jgi:hypothetical protein
VEWRGEEGRVAFYKGRGLGFCRGREEEREREGEFYASPAHRTQNAYKNLISRHLGKDPDIWTGV